MERVSPRDMNADTVAVIGMGMLGRGITACMLGHGFRVVALARSAQRHDEAFRQIEAMIGELVDLAGFDPSLRQGWAARLTQATGFEALRDCSFVIESVLEDVAVKHEVLAHVEAQVLPDVIIASNSSAIPMSELQRRMKHPERLIGMHWAEPAHATRFLELIRGEHTAESTLQQTAELARRLGKEPSLCQREVPGFIVNRIGYAMYREALNLLEAGVADVETIDRCVRNALGLWATLCGPFRWMDLTGGPELYLKAMAPVLPTLSQATEAPRRMRELAESGARGIINGRGFYDYSPDEARHWEELYRRHAWCVARLQNEYFPRAAAAPVAGRDLPPHGPASRT
jgi:3-hydroxybutyryl-CoA dehydrogenase